MYTHENFAADVEKSFAFLESEYGLYRGQMQTAGAGCWMTYGNASVKVVIEYELGGFCGVSLQNLRHVKVDPLERSEFDLDEVVAVSAPRQQRRRDPRSMGEAVARAAETLKQYGAQVLKGDFDALHARQKKFVDASHKAHPVTGH